MQIESTGLPDVKVLRPRVWADGRGAFMETFRQDWWSAHWGETAFVQENHSVSEAGVLRGLHFQQPYAQGKLVRVVSGSVFDVAVDVRRDSPDFGRWTAVVLSAANRCQLWIPPGFAHGFCVLGGGAELVYKCTEYYHPEAEHTLLWNDADLGIRWPLCRLPILSARDAAGMSWARFQAA